MSEEEKSIKLENLSEFTEALGELVIEYHERGVPVSVLCGMGAQLMQVMAMGSLLTDTIEGTEDDA